MEFGYLLPSYCLSKHFNTMDIFLIKHVSGVYPFILFVLFVILINSVYVNFCGLEKIAMYLRYIRNCFTRFKIMIARRGSTVNGLATIWTLAFTKFAVMSGLILSREILSGSEYSGLTVKVAWLDGSLSLYGKKHLPYVISAIFVLTFFVIIPALGLLCYPLVPQILGLIQERSNINFNQHRPYKCISRALEKPFIHLKPLIDCFQGSCKARCEFYAGLLMCYRLSIIFTFSFTIRAEIFFYNIAVSVVFVIITAIVQPYKKHRDNIITILCVSNIILITLISICHLYYSDTKNDNNLQPLLWLQLVLVLLPFVFFVMFMGWRSWKKLQAFWKQEPLYTPVSTDDTDELDDFPTRALLDSAQFSDARSTNNTGSTSPRLESTSGSSINKGSSQNGSRES